VPVADREVAVRRDRFDARTGQAVDPRLGAVAERDAEDRARQPAGEAAAGAAGTRPGPAVLRGPAIEGRATAIAAVNEAYPDQPGQRSLVRGPCVRAALPDRAAVRGESEPGEIVEDRRVVRRPAALPIVVLDPEQDRRPARRGGAPGPDRVGDVAEMEVAGRRRGEPGQPARAQRPPSVRFRSRASSARVAVKSRR
jgi:hypothetical protein